jgi:hypothetical protein
MLALFKLVLNPKAAGWVFFGRDIYDYQTKRARINRVHEYLHSLMQIFLSEKAIQINNLDSPSCSICIVPHGSFSIQCQGPWVQHI